MTNSRRETEELLEVVLAVLSLDPNYVDKLSRRLKPSTVTQLVQGSKHGTFARSVLDDLLNTSFKLITYRQLSPWIKALRRSRGMKLFKEHGATKKTCKSYVKRVIMRNRKKNEN